MLNYEEKMENLLKKHKKEIEELQQETIIYDLLPKRYDPHQITMVDKLEESAWVSYQAKNVDELFDIIDSFKSIKNGSLVSTAYYSDDFANVVPSTTITEKIAEKVKTNSMFLLETELSSFYGEQPKSTNKINFYFQVKNNILKIKIECKGFLLLNYTYKNLNNGYVFEEIPYSANLKNRARIYSSGKKDYFFIDELFSLIKNDNLRIKLEEKYKK